MTGAETTIVHLHIKSLLAKYVVHQPNIKKKKHFFLLLCQICHQYVKDSTTNPAKSMFIATRVRFPLFKKLAGLKNHVCLSFDFSKIGFRGLGTSFQNKYGVHKRTVFEYIKTTSQTSHQDKTVAEKYRKMDKDRNIRPSSPLKNTIHFRKRNFPVLVSLRVFCPKICVSVK